ncbi:MAG: hypothetical protein Q9226_003676 [Calogaya cf. arnoldii]
MHLRWEAVVETLKARNARQQDPSSPISDVDALRDMLREQFEAILSLNVTICKLDAQAIIDTIQAYGQGFLFKNILPFVKKHVADVAFTRTFLILLFGAEHNGTLKAGLSKNIYRDVFADLVPSFKIESDLNTEKRPKYDHYYVDGGISQQADVNFIDPTELADLLDHCRSMGLLKERGAIMDQLVAASTTVDPSAFGKLFIPLLTRMVQLSRIKNSSLTDTIPRPFFENIVNAYVLRYVGPEPERPRDWTQARTGCRSGCADCSLLNGFLTNPKERVRGFSMAEKRRRHLENQLAGSGAPWTLNAEVAHTRSL